MNAHLSTSRIQQVILFLIMIGLFSCQEAKIESSTEGLSVKIENSSGDDFSYGDPDSPQYFAPYPFNHGNLMIDNKSYEVMILSKKVNKGKTIHVKPLGKMTVSNANRKDTDVIVAIPSDAELEIAEIKDFFDFGITQFGLKQMVEYWYSNRYGLDGSVIKGWEPVAIEDFIAGN